MEDITVKELAKAVKQAHDSWCGLTDDEEKKFREFADTISRTFGVPQAAEELLCDLRFIAEKITFYSVVFSLGVPPEKWRSFETSKLSDEQLEVVHSGVLNVCDVLRIIVLDRLFNRGTKETPSK